MLKILGIPRAVLPAVTPSSGVVGETTDLGWLSAAYRSRASPAISRQRCSARRVWRRARPRTRTAPDASCS